MIDMLRKERKMDHIKCSVKAIKGGKVKGKNWNNEQKHQKESNNPFDRY